MDPPTLPHLEGMLILLKRQGEFFIDGTKLGIAQVGSGAISLPSDGNVTIGTES